MFLKDSILYKESEELGAKIVELSYMNRNFSLVIILPNGINFNGLAELEKNLIGSDLSEITDGVKYTAFRLFLPEFKLEGMLDLKSILMELGLKDIFHPSPFLDGLVESADHDLFVSKAPQKLFIAVDERGSEAAVITGPVAGRPCSGRIYKVPPPELRIDHPFIFLLTHKHKDVPGHRNILFYGRVVKPVFE